MQFDYNVVFIFFFFFLPTSSNNCLPFFLPPPHNSRDSADVSYYDNLIKRKIGMMMNEFLLINQFEIDDCVCVSHPPPSDKNHPTEERPGCYVSCGWIAIICLSNTI